MVVVTRQRREGARRRGGGAGAGWGLGFWLGEGVEEGRRGEGCGGCGGGLRWSEVGRGGGSGGGGRRWVRGKVGSGGGRKERREGERGWFSVMGCGGGDGVVVGGGGWKCWWFGGRGGRGCREEKEKREMVKSVDFMKAYRQAKKATAASKISAKTAEGESSQVPPKKPVSSASGPRKVVPTPQVRIIPSDPARQSTGTTSSPTVGPPPRKQKTVEPFDLDAPDFDAVGFVDNQIAPFG
nr:uncharacterized protein LOC112763495 [Arachis hypogaea]